MFVHKCEMSIQICVQKAGVLTETLDQSSWRSRHQLKNRLQVQHPAAEIPPEASRASSWAETPPNSLPLTPPISEIFFFFPKQAFLSVLPQ